MYIFNLGERPWEQSMLIFHALARIRIEAIKEFYENTDIQTPGVKPKDITKAIMETK